MMFGYACDETPELMPLPIMLAHQLVKNLDQAREQQLITYLCPDGKAQVVIDYLDGQPQQVSTIIMAVPYDPQISKKQLRQDLWDKVIVPAVQKYLPKQILDKKIITLIINGTGAWEMVVSLRYRFNCRKIIIDTYGGMGRHGGGCFSVKIQVKLIVLRLCLSISSKKYSRQGLAKRCEVQVAFVLVKPPLYF
jgi:S-adenosylmethionine synthetase